jgi:iron complex transport system ATP-binding protein
MTEAVVELIGVTVMRSGRPILADVHWTVAHGERWVVLGPNGSGKTTLLQILSTYLWPSRGRVRVVGAEMGAVDARELRRAIGYASPALAATIDPELSAVDVVMTARHAALAPWWHTFTDADRRRASLLLERMGCGALGERTFGTLSSGERQRVQIARTLMSDPTLLLLDEPASGLDLGAREALATRLNDLAVAADPAAIVLVTHHVEEIPAGFSHALVLADGRVVASGPIAGVLTSEVLTSAYALPLEVAQENGRFRAWARVDTNGCSPQLGAAASSRASRRRTAGRMPPLR